MSQLRDRIETVIRRVETQRLSTAPRYTGPHEWLEQEIRAAMSNALGEVRAEALKEIDRYEAERLKLEAEIAVAQIAAKKIEQEPLTTPISSVRESTLEWVRQQEAKAKADYVAQVTAEPAEPPKKYGLLPFSVLNPAGELKFMLWLSGIVIAMVGIWRMVSAAGIKMTALTVVMGVSSYSLVKILRGPK